MGGRRPLVAAVGAGAWPPTGCASTPAATVLVAARDLEAGHVLVAADFASAPLRASPTPPSARPRRPRRRARCPRVPWSGARRCSAPLATASPPPRGPAPPGLELRGGDRVDVRVTRPGAPPLAAWWRAACRWCRSPRAPRSTGLPPRWRCCSTPPTPTAWNSPCAWAGAGPPARQRERRARRRGRAPAGGGGREGARAAARQPR